jgi:hypothetical protein
VVSAVLLLAVVAAVSYLALSGSTQRTVDTQRSVADLIEQKGSQVQELLSVISRDTSANKVTLEIMNYGIKSIIIDKVFLDGTQSPFSLLDSDGSVFFNQTVPPKQIMMLQLSGHGQSIQIVTSSKNVISLPLN